MLNLFRRQKTHTVGEIPRLHSVLSWERDHVRAAVVKLSDGVADLLGVGVSPVHGLGRAQYPDPERWYVGADLALTQAEDLSEHGRYGRKAVADSATMSVPDSVTRAVMVRPKHERSHPLRPIKTDDVRALLQRGYREALDWLDRHQQERRLIITCGSTGQVRLDGRPVLDAIGLQGTLLEADMCFFAVPAEWMHTLESLAEKLELSLSSIIPQQLAYVAPVTEGLTLFIDDHESTLDLVRQGNIAWSARCEMGAIEIVNQTLGGLPLPAPGYGQLMQEYRRATLGQENLDLIASRYWAALQTWMDCLCESVPDPHRQSRLPQTIYGLDLSRKVPEALLALETPRWEKALSFRGCPQSVPLESLKGGHIIDWTSENSSPAPLSLASLAFFTARQFSAAGDLDRALLGIVDWHGAA